MTLNIAIHKNIMVKILKDIYSDATIGPILGFKGGTAAYLLYQLERFSVDLDFDLLDAEKEDYVFERVKSILMKYGTFKDIAKKRFNLFYLLSYEGKIEGATNVKVEINRRDSSSKYNVKYYLGIPMKVMNQEDMAAHKIVAMFERLGTTNRDIFDVWFFLKNDWPIHKEIIERRNAMSFKEFLQKCIDALEKLDNSNILSGLGELLTDSQKDWVRAKLRTETIFLLKLKLENEI
ncbi:MAG: nucleotidyl transferase AbiEii/AbiGii toxin family protein [Candidatus Taylorbacteria bacterium]|nr:nucleotidyl transferase AbiEii/AbiGii toxin family protein [Candidatus Taylorbacteria bacterium]